MEDIKVIDFAYVRKDSEARSVRPQPKNNVFFRRNSCSPPTPIDEIFLRNNKCFDDNLILFRKQIPVPTTRDEEEEERSRPENEIDSQFDPEDDYQNLTFSKKRLSSDSRPPVPELVEDVTTDEDSDHKPTTGKNGKAAEITTASRLFKHDISDPEDQDSDYKTPDEDVTTLYGRKTPSIQHQHQHHQEQSQPRLLLGLLIWNTLCHTFRDLLTSTQQTLRRAEDYIKDTHILHHKHYPRPEIPTPIPIPRAHQQQRFDFRKQLHADISQHQAVFHCVIGILLCLLVWAFSCVACFFGPRRMVQMGLVLFCLVARPDRLFSVVTREGEKREEFMERKDEDIAMDEGKRGRKRSLASPNRSFPPTSMKHL